LAFTDLGGDQLVAYGSGFTLATYGGAWNGGLLQVGGNSLADDSTFALGSNLFQINYNGGGGSNQVTITSFNATPTDLALTPSSINENSAIGSNVGTLTGVDANPGHSASLTFTLESGEGSDDNSSFTIDGTSLKTAVPLNFEADASYSVRIRATDVLGAFYEEAVMISVTDVNEVPTITDVADQSIAEDSATAELAFTVGDPETAPGSLLVTGTSNNTALVPVANIALGGSGASRNVKVTPVADFAGTATITIHVSDGVIRNAGAGRCTRCDVVRASVGGGRNRRGSAVSQRHAG
jgi:hypothetical protein